MYCKAFGQKFWLFHEGIATGLLLQCLLSVGLFFFEALENNMSHLCGNSNISLTVKECYGYISMQKLLLLYYEYVKAKTKDSFDCAGIINKMKSERDGVWDQ